jgi:uroporphyrinogen decarboxylase
LVESMDSRKRIILSMEHRQPDRVPIDFSGHRSSGISAIAYSKLRQFIGLPEKPIRVYDVIQQLAIVDEDVLDLFHVDTIELGRGFLLNDSDWKDWVLPDGTPCQIPYYIHVEKRDSHWFLLSDNGTEMGVQKQGCLYFEQTYYPLEDSDFASDSFDDLEKHFETCMWTSAVHPGAHLPLTPAGLSEMAEKAQALRASTSRAIVGLFGGSIFEVPQYLYRNENYLTYMALYPDAVHRLSEKLTGIYLNNLEKWLGAVGPYIDIILFGGEDLGGQNGPLFSPLMYREFYKPYHAKLWRRAKELADVKVQLHCCGGIRPILGDLIEAGIDAFNPVQITSDGMDALELKNQFGHEVTFWGGGCDTRDILGNATPDQVKEHVNQQLQILYRDGGFVFQQVHNIMADVPPENIVAMFRAVNEFG